jgi:hypothetical protein
MLPIPHIVLFAPICVFIGFAIGAAITQSVAGIMAVPARRPNPARPRAAGPSAKIYYFKPAKTPLRSYPDRVGGPLAMPHR